MTVRARPIFRVAIILVVVAAYSMYPTTAGSSEPPDNLTGDIAFSDGVAAPGGEFLQTASATRQAASSPPNLAAVASRPTTRAVEVRAFDERTLQSPSVKLTVFDRTFEFRTELVEAGGGRWMGSDGAGSSASIVIRDGSAAGTIRAADGSLYSITPAGRGIVVIADVDPTAFPPPGEPSAVSGPDDGTATDPLASDDGSIITVIVAYTAAARVTYGGTAGIEAHITLAATESNTAYANSGIIPRISLVHMYETPTPETGAGSNTDFAGDRNRFQTPGDGSFDEVHALRNTHAADLAVLITSYTAPTICGIAFLDSTATTAFSVTQDFCAVGNYTFSHEIGHNIGARHDDDPTGMFGYDRGHIFVGGTDTWRTIMGKGSNCGNCTRIQHFSNPDVVFDGTATGTVTTNDAARVHDERAFNVANFRVAGPSRLYVDADATEANDGSSWGDAFTDLQSALAIGAGREIWVAEGVYTPGSTRTDTFTLQDASTVYGGFTGNGAGGLETQLDQRDWQAHPTVLSGDIGVGGDSSDNSRHVVTSTSLASNTVLDGFTISGGNADLAPDDDGGGLLNISSSPTLRNLVFASNSAADRGGAIYSLFGGPSISHSSFVGNEAAIGGAIVPEVSTPTLDSLSFDGNTAIQGGAIYNLGASPPITNSSFFGNTATGVGGAIRNQSSATALTNVTLSGNTGLFGGGGIYHTSGDFTMSHLTITANAAPLDPGGGASGGGIKLIGGTVGVDNSIVAGNTSGTAGVEDCAGPFAATGYNLTGTGTGCTTGGTGDQTTTDALLGPLSDNGGATETHALLVGSPAINSGGSAAFDQRGVPRPQGAAADIGAFEVIEATSEGLVFVPTPPCAAFDTRPNKGGSDAITAGSSKVFRVLGSGLDTQGGALAGCGLPADPVGVLLNLVAVASSGFGHLEIAPTGGSGGGDVVNYNNFASSSGKTMNNSNALPVPLNRDGIGGEVEVFAVGAVGADTQARGVILGYFTLPQAEQDDGLVWRQATACALFDTRTAQNLYVTPGVIATLPANTVGGLRVDVVDASTVNGCPQPIPQTAAAVYMNVIAPAPQGAGNLRVSEGGIAPGGGVVNYQDFASTALNKGLNNANALVVELNGDGEIDVQTNGVASHARGVLLGWLSTLANDPTGLLFHFTTTCTAFDTTSGGTPIIPGTEQTFDVVGTPPGCDIPTDADAVFLTVVAADPQGPGNFKAVPQGVPPPGAGGGIVNYQDFTPATTMLNSNAVIIGLNQTGTGGQIDIHANNAGSHARGNTHGYLKPPPPT